MKNHKDKKAQKRERKVFLRNKRENESKTGKVIASAAGNSAIVMHVRNRTGGRARKVRRG